MEKIEKELKDSLDCIISDSLSDIHGDRISSYRYQQIENFIILKLLNIRQIIIEDVPHQYQDRLLKELD
jgi:hypothetical protein